MCQNTEFIGRDAKMATMPTINEIDHRSEGNANDMKAPKNTLVQILMWSVLTFISKEFSVFLPTSQSHAGAKTFVHAGYHYDQNHSSFDNTILTWGTDYIIAVIFTYAGISCLQAANKTAKGAKVLNTNTNEINEQASKGLRVRSSLLFSCYAVSVLSGGYAHYTFKTIEELNSMQFRICWIICVGCVTAAGGFMGSCGSQIYLAMNHSVAKEKVRFRLVHVSDLLWFIYGGFMTYVCANGEISYQRPACDIFVAGTSQFVPTVFCVLVVLSIKWTDAKPILEAPVDMIGNVNPSAMIKAIKRSYRYTFYIGLFLNAPLLPSYPQLVQNTNLSLGQVNALLHLNLTIAWGMQAISLRHFCTALSLNREGSSKKD
mmetsp:Transcript_20225/g.29780  ORF Transcript_20225/g.29780 Transcript_20225/m.29780 type:complete len:374 (-) Transcript_20225:106-1227(-)